MSKRLRRGLIITVVVLAGLVLFGYFQFMVLPKPQIISAVGQVAPDFTLADQNGTPFKLSSLHGQPVLLMFYRGYW